MPKHLFWDSIAEKRDDYIAQYQPPISDMPFSTLSLTFLGKVSPEAAAIAAEQELELWIGLYKVPLFVSTFDKTGSLIDLKSVRAESHLIGFFDVEKGSNVRFWEILKNEFLPKDQVQVHYLLRTFVGIPVRTQDEIQERVRRESKVKARGNRILTFFLIIWAAVPIILDRLSSSWYWVQILVTAYCFWNFSVTALELLALKQPSKSDLEKREKKQKMDHYYYHCERNLLGFASLRAENLSKESEEEIRAEAERLATTKK